MHSLTIAWLAGAAGALIAIPAAFGMARRWGILDRPAGYLKPHHGPVPRTGGLLIASALLIGTVLAVGLARPDTSPPRACLVGAVLAFLVGCADDVRPLSPRVKFGLLLGCAVVVVSLGGSSRLTAIPLFDALFSVFCLLGGANAMNLMDGLDALAGGLIAVAALFMALLAVRFGEMGTGLALMALLGGAMVFLRFNRPPARLFLGDGGSLGAGFFLAGVAIHYARGPEATVRLTAALLALAIPILETASSIARRAAGGRSPLDADRDHMYDLVARQLGDARAAVAIFLVIAMALAWTALVYPDLAARFPPAVLGGAGAALALFAALCGPSLSGIHHSSGSRRVTR